MEKIVLKQGLEFKHLDRFVNYLETYKSEILDRTETLKLKNSVLEIKALLDDLYVLPEEIRDESLREEFGITYKEAFSRRINVLMQIDVMYFELLNQYRAELTKLCEHNNRNNF